MSIGELADAGALTRRAVRFYVQQRLIPPPGGVGRGRHYNQSHLERIKKIGQLQSAGHSLAAIRRILDGETDPTVTQSESIIPKRAAISAQLWTRIRIGEGIELQFDPERYQPEAEGLLALCKLARDVLVGEDEPKG